ncbi:MAG: MetQ/NlpA family ABC transporter substrate-binding protein [Coriobacteriales bacterium]|nr:MetQ/NlpA family ABC transporter substrate-binding protein [Coriobacteriales bacterium]
MKRLICVLVMLCAITLSACAPAKEDTATQDMPSAQAIRIGIPDDGTNLFRGIKLLEAAGLITVDPNAGYTPQMKDITGALYNVEVVPEPADSLPSTLADFGASAINGNYAIPNNLIPSRDGLIIERQSEGENNPYVNVIAARTADAGSETFKKIVDAYQTQLVAELMLVNYEEIYYPAFAYDANIKMTAEEAKEISAYTSSREGKTVVRVGVCGANNDMWKAVQKNLDDENAGIYIELVEFDSYEQPNAALNAGEIDLNAFQHKAYLNDDATANGYDLTAIGDTLIAPLTMYSARFDSLDALKEAAGASAQ